MASAASSLRGGNDRFNAEAASWDSNPFVHTASRHAADAIIPRFPKLNNPPGPDGLDVLEIGCGTGLLSCLVAPYAKRVVAVDAAQGMVDVLKLKLGKAETPQNILPVAVLLEDPEDPCLPPANEQEPAGPRLKFDLITSHLVMHHIPDLKAVLITMLGCLKAGGSVALTDFENTGPESRRFHPHFKMGGVERDGIQARWMKGLMEEVGFVNVRIERAWSMDKRVERVPGEFGEHGELKAAGLGEIQSFPFILCSGDRA